MGVSNKIIDNKSVMKFQYRDCYSARYDHSIVVLIRLSWRYAMICLPGSIGS